MNAPQPWPWIINAIKWTFLWHDSSYILRVLASWKVRSLTCVMIWRHERKCAWMPVPCICLNSKSKDHRCEFVVIHINSNTPSVPVNIISLYYHTTPWFYPAPEIILLTYQDLAAPFHSRDMTSETPDSLLRLAGELSKLSAELSTIGGKLALVATALEQEAANVAAENTKRWGVNVQVAVRTGPYGAMGNGSEIIVQK